MLSVLVITTILIIVLLLPTLEDSYYRAILDKHRILENAKSPKIVLAGGSNITFSIDSAAIQKTFDIPVVNIGIFASIGLGRILDDVSSFLNSGDILVIAPEYEHFINMWNGNADAFSLIFNTRQYRLLWSPYYYGVPVNFNAYLLYRLKVAVARYLPQIPSRPLSRYGFNEYGDYIQHLTMENQPITPAGNIGAVNPVYLTYFSRLIDNLTSRGITVVLSYPCYEEESFRNSAGTIAALDAAFRSKESLRVISKPEDYCFPAGLFYDTQYHLNAEGRTLRTKQLIADLEASGLLGGQ